MRPATRPGQPPPKLGGAIAQARPPSPAQPALAKRPAAAAAPQTLVVQCKTQQDDLGLETLVGEYAETGGTNHGRKVFKRKKQAADDDTVFLYFWDKRDGPDFEGWYFGEEVGGAQVWSRCERTDLAPPKTGWRVPFNGDVQPDLMVMPKQAVAAQAAAGKAKAPGAPAPAQRVPQAGVRPAAQAAQAAGVKPAPAPVGAAPQGEAEPAATTAAKAPAESEAASQLRVQQATDRVAVAEVEATQALESARAMLEGGATEDSLKIAEELLQSQQAALMDGQTKLARDLMAAKRLAPKTVAALNALTVRVKAMQTKIVPEMKQIKELAAKQKQEAEEQRQKAKAEEQQMLAEQRDAKVLEESLPEAMDVVTTVEDALEAVVTAAAALASTSAEQMNDTVLAAIRETEGCVAKAQESIKTARAKLTQKIAAARQFAPEAKKVALTEYQALLEKINESQKKVAPYMRVRREQEQTFEARKVMREVTTTLGSVEVEVEKLAAVLAGSEASEAAVRAAEASCAPAAASLAGALKLVEQRLQKAEGALKGDLLQMQERGQGSKKKLEELRAQLKAKLEQLQAQAVLRQGLEKTRAAEEAMAKTEEAEAPFLKGLELEGAEAAEAVACLKGATGAAEAAASAAKAFLKARIGDLKRLQEEAARAAALGELAELATRVEAVLQKIGALKKETVVRETAVLLREVKKKLSDAEAGVQKTVELSAPLLAEDLENVDAAKLKEASEQTLEAEKAAALSCAEARKALVAKQREAQQLRDAPECAAELSKLQGRLTAAQQELGKQRKVAVQGEKLWKGKLLVQEKDEEMKRVEADVEKAAALATPVGDEALSNEAVLEVDASASSIQKVLADVVKPLESAQQGAQASLKAQMQALLARAKTAQERLDGMKEATRERSERLRCEAALAEARARLERVDAGFQQVAEAEAPYLKGMEVLPGEEADKALADCEAAAAAVQQAIAEARDFLASKTLEVKALVAAVSEAGLEELAALTKRNEEATEKLAQFREETDGRRAVALQQLALAKVAAAEEAVQRTVAAAAPLLSEQAEEVSQEAAKEIMEKLGAAAKEASERLEDARQFLQERQRDKKVPADASELSKLLGRVKAAESEQNKAKAGASDHEQRLLAKVVLQEATGQLQALEAELGKATAAAAPLTEDGGKSFIVASMTKMVTEALGEHCHASGLSREDLYKQIGAGAAEGKATREEFDAFLEKVPELCSRPDLGFSVDQRAAIFERADADKDGLLSPQEFAELFREQFVCVHEVALTDGRGIAESKALGKIQVDDVVEAISEPSELEDLGIMRLEVRLLKEDGENAKGWVTMQGNQGTTYFRPFTAFAAFVKSLTATLSAALEVHQKTTALISAKSAELRDCKDGPLSNARAELTRMRLKINTARTRLDHLSKKVEEGKRDHSRREEFEKRKQEEKKERQAASLVLKAISEKVEQAELAARQLQEAAAPLTSAAEAELGSVAAPATVRSAAASAAAAVSAAVAEARECLTAQEGRAADAGPGPWEEARQEMAKLGQRLAVLERDAASTRDRVQEACDSLAALKLGQVSTALRASLQERGLSAGALFAELADGKEQIPEARLAQCLEDLPGLGLSPEQRQLVLLRCAAAAGGVGRRGFLGLVERFSRCIKEVTLTSDFDIKSSSTVRKLAAGELVEVLDGPRSDDAIGVARVKVRALPDGAEGWASVRGNQGTAYLQDCARPCYVCTQAFALQQGFPSEDTPEIRTVKPGEVIEVIEGPRQEVRGSAARARVKALSDDATGWITVTSRTGRSCARQGQSTYTCKSGIALTDAMNIKDCKVLRKLDKGEVLMVLEGPIDDAAAGVSRVKAKAKKDKAEGWVTTRGNAGSVYAEETGRTYVLEAAAPLQADFASGSAEVRMLAEGESVEVLEGPKDEASEPLSRLHGRAVSDGQQGWFTLDAERASPWSPQYRCLSAAPLSDSLGAGQGQALRELAVGETVEALEGPLVDAEQGVLRLKCRAASDEAVGWATVFGKEGEAFLECVASE